jgi:hypothetical protein
MELENLHSMRWLLVRLQAGVGLPKEWSKAKQSLKPNIQSADSCPYDPPFLMRTL